MQKFSALFAVVATTLCFGLSAAAQSTPAPSSNPIPSPLSSLAANLLSKVDPIYPMEAKAAHTEGTVVLDALISKTGEISRLKVISGDQIFRTSAEEAVIQWKFKPYLVDGAPAQVETYITMKYRYGGSEEPQIQTLLQDAVVVQPGTHPKVSPPRVTYQVELQFTEAERKAGFHGSVFINLWVNEQGNPINVHVLRGTGTALDQNALEAVKQYRFKPAMENGEPLLVELTIGVNIASF
jgi:TonB family protein